MAFALLGVAGMFPSALRSVVTGGQVTKATTLAQEMVDMIRNEPFDTLSLTPASANGYKGYYTFDTRNLPATCPTGSTDSSSCSNKMKWKSDLSADSAQAGGRGLPAGYGTVAVACLNANGTSNSTSPCPTDLRRVTVTAIWGRTGAQSVSLVTYVARTE